MRRTLLAATMLASLSVAGHAQTIQSGTIGGMPYQVLMPSTPCTSANPCGVVTYLGYQDASYQDATNGLQNYFAPYNLHAIVIAPTITQSQDYTTNWGGYARINTPQQDQMVAVVQGVEAQMGNTVNPADSVVTGGSLGGDGTQAALIAYGPKGTVQPGVFSSGVSFDAATYAAAGNAQDIAALCGVPLMAVHGTDDTNQSVTYDQNLQSAIDSNPACNNSFTFVPVQGAGHGTWGGPAGYNAGTGAGTPLGTIAADLPVSPAANSASTVAAQPVATSAPAAAATKPATSTGASATAAASSNGTVNINLSAPVTMSGGNNSLLLGFPWGGGNQQTLSSNGEGETYETSGVTRNADGSITLTAQPNNNTGASWPNDLPYVSGAISTASINNGMPQPGGFSATYGYFQMTAELPTGAGLWPAFWLEPVDGKSPCEIDIFEAPFNNPSIIQDSLHDQPVGSGYTTGQVTVPNYSTNFNTYGVNWNAQTITYYVNGAEVGSTPTPASCNSAAYILANLAVGGQAWSWPGTPNGSNSWPASMVIQSITYNPNGPPGGPGGDGGTYSGGLVGASTGAGGATPSAPGTTTPTGAAPAATGGPGAAAALPVQEIAPSDGSVTDCSGNTWDITGDNKIQENGQLVLGGGDTSELMIVGCTVYGLSNGHNSKVGWFNMSTVDQSGHQFWNYMGPTATPPTGGTTGAATAAAIPSTGAATTAALPTASGTKPPAVTGPIALKKAAQYACTTSAPNSPAASGGFATIDGVIYQPNGTPWIARGVDLHADNLAAAAAALPGEFPGINMVRVAVGDYGSLTDPSVFQAAVQSLTSQGIVVEFSDYSNSLGTGSGGSQGTVFTGALLANENAWFAAMATMYKNNPYVWLGTDNEPSTQGGSLSDWQLSNYQAIRGTGNTAPILLEPSGDAAGNFRGGAGSPLQAAMNPADYANMENIIWDPHVYAYMDGNSSDQGTANAMVQAVIAATQSIQGLDGTVPVIIGEFNPATDGGQQSANAVLSSGVGSTAWVWDDDDMVGGPSGDPTALYSSGQMTAFGQQVAQFISGSGNPGCNLSPDPTSVATNATVTPSASDMAAINAAAATLQTTPGTTATQ
jgi:beta-glucanase (GH16 family)